MSGYYDEILEEITQMINEGNAEEALYLIRKELAMPYIPQDAEEALMKLKKDAVFAKTEKDTSHEKTTEELLNMLKGKSFSQLTAAEQLADRNLRGCIDQIKEYLSKEPLPEAAALLIDAIAQQEIQDEFVIVKDGLEYTFWGDAVTPVAQSEGLIGAIRILDDLTGKDPAMHEMARSVLVHDAYLYLPLSYEREESNMIAMNAVRQVSELMDGGETYRKAAEAVKGRS